MGGSSGCLWWVGLTGVNAVSGFEQFNNDIDANLHWYGITASGGTNAQKMSAGQSAMFSGDYFSKTLGWYAQNAFKNAHGDIEIVFGVEGLDGCKTDEHTISCGTTYDYIVQTIIHEFGHVFDNQFQDIVNNGHLASDYPVDGWDATYDGYQCHGYPCVQHPASGSRGRVEDFADMYLNWVLDANPAYPDNGFTTDEMGNARRDMMNNTVNDATHRGMPVWLEMMGLR